MLPAKGLLKLAEECSELAGAATKQAAYWGEEYHPDDGYSLREKVLRETADVLAAIKYVIEKFGLNTARIRFRKQEKLDRWQRKKMKNRLWATTEANTRVERKPRRSSRKNHNRRRQKPDEKLVASQK